MSTLSDLVLDLFAQENWRRLLDLARSVDPDMKMESMSQIIRGVRDLEELCGQNSPDFRLTPAQRRSYAALGDFVGLQNVLFFCSELPVINDKALVSYMLKKAEKSDAWLIRSNAVKAVKARQVEISHLLIDWLLRKVPKQMNHQEMYLLYEASIFDGKADYWIFKKIVLRDMVWFILKQASESKMGICKEFLHDVTELDMIERKKMWNYFKK